MSIDRLALSRAQHLQSHHRVDENDEGTISDWSESDRECCPLSDVELFSNADGTTMDFPSDDEFAEEKLPRTNTFLEQVLNLPSTPNDVEKKKISPIVAPTKKCSNAPLLPARRPPPSRSFLRRQNTTTSVSFRKDSLSNSSASQDEVHRGPTASPNPSQTSTSNNSRLYEVKKLFLDETDYGRLTDLSIVKPLAGRNRQKWGTIVHPPFPLGYQQVPPDHIHHVVERLTSPSRSRDRRTPSQMPSRRYLSIEETDALISRLTKTKPIRTTDPYFPLQRSSKPVKNLRPTLKSTPQLKTVGVSA